MRERLYEMMRAGCSSLNSPSHRVVMFASVKVCKWHGKSEIHQIPHASDRQSKGRRYLAMRLSYGRHKDESSSDIVQAVEGPRATMTQSTRQENSVRQGIESTRKCRSQVVRIQFRGLVLSCLQPSGTSVNLCVHERNYLDFSNVRCECCPFNQTHKCGRMLRTRLRTRLRDQCFQHCASRR